MRVALPHTIAIDGPAGSGKSSVSFAIARDLNYLFVDTGAFYRAVTLAALRAGFADADEATLASIAERCQLDVTSDLDADGRAYTLLLDGEDVTWQIRNSDVERAVSRVAAIGGVRDILNEKYRQLAARGEVIMAGP